MTVQSALPWPSSHRGDPSTSYLAEEQHTRSGRRATNTEAVATALRSMPGAVASELAERTGLDVVEVRRRLDDLHKAGRVAQGKAKRRHAGHPAQVTWTVVDGGPR